MVNKNKTVCAARKQNSYERCREYPKNGKQRFCAASSGRKGRWMKIGTKFELVWDQPTQIWWKLGSQMDQMKVGFQFHSMLLETFTFLTRKNCIVITVWNNLDLFFRSLPGLLWNAKPLAKPMFVAGFLFRTRYHSAPFTGRKRNCVYWAITCIRK